METQQANNNPAQAHTEQQLLEMIKTGKMGVPIVTQLVQMSQVRPEDTVTMQAIAASLDAKLIALGITDQDLFHWLRACCLASYALGQTNLFRPKRPQKQNRKPA